MNLKDIPADEVLQGKNWVLSSSGGHEGNPAVQEAIGFTPQDTGVCAAVCKFADGSEHPALVVRSFSHDGEDTAIWVHTKFGWMEPQTPGFTRAVGKYTHEIYEFSWFLADPWKSGAQPAPDRASDHPKLFKAAVARIRAKSAPTQK